MERLPASLCVRCKGVKYLCRRPSCPILLRLRTIKPIAKRLADSRSIFGPSPPSVLVGEYGYPAIGLGPLVLPEKLGDVAKYDAPETWCRDSVPLDEIVRLRTSLFYSRFKSSVLAPRRMEPRLLRITQELSMALGPTDVEVSYRKPPKFRLSFDGVTKPVGIVGLVREMDIAENPRVPRVIDRVVGDTSVKASTAIQELYDRGVSVYGILKLLSLGLLGVRKHRRLVPTRWAITATDVSVANQLLGKVRGYKEVGEISLYHHTYLGNHYEILLIPRSYAFEVVEAWLPRSLWSLESRAVIHSTHEFYDGRASAMDGGYFAARLAVLEHLFKQRRQATAVIIREIRPSYYAPVGVWQIREGVRMALDTSCENFDELSEALDGVARRLKTPQREWLRRSKILQFLKVQSTLLKWFEWKRSS